MAIRKRVPATDAVTEVQFSLTDPSYPFVGAAAAADCHMMLEEILPRGDGRYAEFFRVLGGDCETILDLAAEHGKTDATLLSESENGGLFEFVVSGDCPAVFLSERGALPRAVNCTGDSGLVAAEVPPSRDATAIAAEFLDAHEDAELVAKREQPYETPMFGHREFGEAIEERLTQRQREVLEAAHDAGYYEWPRRTDGEEIAAELGISPSTFREHLRTVEQRLVELVFHRTSPGASDDRPVAGGGPSLDGGRR